MTHHAYLYIAPTVATAGVPTTVLSPGADVTYLVEPAFGIATARELTRLAHLKPLTLSKRFFVVHFSSITVEAQNALLKLLEEPPATAEFHIVVSSEQLLLPTVRSRLQLAVQSVDTVEPTIFKTFIALSVADRVALIADKVKAKDDTWLQGIFSGVQQQATLKTGSAASLQTIDFFVRNFNRRGAAKKMLLEYLALSQAV